MSEESRKVQEDIKASVHKIWLAGLGALAAAEEEGTKIFNSLIEKGEVYELRGRDELAKVRERVEGAIGKAGDSWEKLGDSLDEKVAGAIERLGVPNRDELETLTKRVEELTFKIDQLRAGIDKSA